MKLFENSIVHLFVLAAMLPLLFMSGCGADINPDDSANMIETESNYASNPQFLEMSDGDILLWWVQKNAQTNENEVAYATSADQGESFSKHKIIPVSSGANEANGEGPPRMAVKPDGTMILVYNKPNPMPEFRFAGDVLFTQSLDGGATWSEPKPIHTDGIRESGQGFTVLETLSNGEVAALWLDGRHKTESSAIYMAITEGDKGFGKDRKIGAYTCQCCKNSMIMDNDGNLHVAYRGLKNGIRDIMYFYSSDLGKTFSEPRKISDDNWQLDACPHNGPDLAYTGKALHAVWYTNTDKKGIFFASKSTETNDEGFVNKFQLSKNELAKHVKIVSLNKNTSVVLWDEKIKSVADDGMVSRLAYKVIKNGQPTHGNYLTTSDVQAQNPSAITLDEKRVLVAWSENDEDGKHIRYQKLNISNLLEEKIAAGK